MLCPICQFKEKIDMNILVLCDEYCKEKGDEWCKIKEKIEKLVKKFEI
jgi:hypothetical protein